jgi:5-formyltetrahydrofolate cyclo-ligase
LAQGNRKTLRRQRLRLTDAEQQQAAAAVAQSALALVTRLKVQTLGAYWPNDGELSALPILHQALVLSLTCTLPIISNQTLTFSRIGPTTRFQNNRYEILEPIADAHSEIPLRQHDALFMPLVGFNQNGDRLGMGGGYYDRTLAGCLTQPFRPCLIGLAHDFQRCEFSSNPWDIPLDYVLTPQETLKIN